MNYFLKGLFRDSQFYWWSRIYIAVAAVGVVDLISSALKPPGLFHYKWFIGTVIFSILLLIIYGIYLGKLERNRKIEEQTDDFLASHYEPRREKEIRDLLVENPPFTTHCYECLHFDQDKKGCKRHMSNQRVKDLWVGHFKYCLYWETLDDPS